MSRDPQGTEQASGRGRPPSNELDARKLQAINYYLSDPNKANVAEKLGVTPKTVSRWFQDPVFVAEYNRQLDDIRLDLWAQMNAAKDEAWARLMILLRVAPPPISLRATTWLIDRLLSPPKFLDRSEAPQTGIAESLEARERELLELLGVLGRGDAAHDDPDDGESTGSTQ